MENELTWRRDAKLLLGPGPAAVHVYRHAKGLSRCRVLLYGYASCCCVPFLSVGCDKFLHRGPAGMDGASVAQLLLAISRSQFAVMASTTIEPTTDDELIHLKTVVARDEIRTTQWGV